MLNSKNNSNNNTLSKMILNNNENENNNISSNKLNNIANNINNINNINTNNISNDINNISNNNINNISNNINNIANNVNNIVNNTNNISDMNKIISIKDLYFTDNFFFLNYINKLYSNIHIPYFTSNRTLFNCMYLELIDNDSKIIITNTYERYVNKKYSKSFKKYSDRLKLVDVLNEDEKDLILKEYVIDNYRLNLNSFNFIDQSLINHKSISNNKNIKLKKNSVLIPIIIDNINIKKSNSENIKYLICYIFVDILNYNKCNIYTIYYLNNEAIKSFNKYINELVNTSFIKSVFKDNIQFKNNISYELNNNNNNINDVNYIANIEFLNSIYYILTKQLPKNNNVLLNLLDNIKNNKKIKLTKNLIIKNLLTKTY